MTEGGTGLPVKVKGITSRNKKEAEVGKQEKNQQIQKAPNKVTKGCPHREVLRFQSAMGFVKNDAWNSSSKKPNLQ